MVKRVLKQDLSKYIPHAKTGSLKHQILSVIRGLSFYNKCCILLSFLIY